MPCIGSQRGDRSQSPGREEYQPDSSPPKPPVGSQLTPYRFIEFVHCREQRRTQRGEHQKLFCISLVILGEYKLAFELKLVANYSEKTGSKIVCHSTWALKVARLPSRIVAQSLAIDVHKKLHKLTLISIPKKKTIYNCLQNEQTGKFSTYISMVISNKEWLPCIRTETLQYNY